jgi:hypothetical protein
VLRGRLRLRSPREWMCIEMNANDSMGRAVMPGWAMGWNYFMKAEHGRLRVPIVNLAVIRRSGVAAATMHCLLCVSLWITLLAAIWMSRGWIGLLFSGQLLSVGACLFQKLARRTQFAFAGNRRPVHEWAASTPEGEQNAP